MVRHTCTENRLSVKGENRVETVAGLRVPHYRSTSTASTSVPAPVPARGGCASYESSVFGRAHSRYPKPSVQNVAIGQGVCDLSHGVVRFHQRASLDSRHARRIRCSKMDSRRASPMASSCIDTAKHQHRTLPRIAHAKRQKTPNRQ